MESDSFPCGSIFAEESIRQMMDGASMCVDACSSAKFAQVEELLQRYNTLARATGHIELQSTEPNTIRDDPSCDIIVDCLVVYLP